MSSSGQIYSNSVKLSEDLQLSQKNVHQTQHFSSDQNLINLMGQKTMS